MGPCLEPSCLACQLPCEEQTAVASLLHFVVAEPSCCECASHWSCEFEDFLLHWSHSCKHHIASLASGAVVAVWMDLQRTEEDLKKVDAEMKPEIGASLEVLKLERWLKLDCWWFHFEGPGCC